MRLSKKTVWAAIVVTLFVLLTVGVGIGAGIVNVFPMARAWTTKALETRNIDAARRALGDLGKRLGDDRLSELSRRSEAVTALADLAGTKELTELLKWTTSVPGLGSLVQSGAYQRAIEEAVRQNVANISQISLDQVASPETRALLAEVKQVIATNPETAEAASAVNVDVLKLLKSDAFARLRQTPEVSRILSGLEPARATE